MNLRKEAPVPRADDSRQAVEENAVLAPRPMRTSPARKWALAVMTIALLGHGGVGALMMGHATRMGQSYNSDMRVSRSNGEDWLIVTLSRETSYHSVEGVSIDVMGDTIIVTPTHSFLSWGTPYLGRPEAVAVDLSKLDARRYRVILRSGGTDRVLGEVVGTRKSL